MAKNKSKTVEDLLKEQNELIKNQMIITLGLANVPQPRIREIVGVDIHRVSKVVRRLKREKKNG